MSSACRHRFLGDSTVAAKCQVGLPTSHVPVHRALHPGSLGLSVLRQPANRHRSFRSTAHLACPAQFGFTFAQGVLMSGKVIVISASTCAGAASASSLPSLTGWSIRRPQAALAGALRAAHSGAAYRGR